MAGGGKGSFFGGRFLGLGLAVLEEAGEPGGGAPTGAAGADDGDEGLGEGVEAGFGDLLGELLVALEEIENGDVVDAELRGGLAEGKSVGDQTEQTALGEFVERWGAAAADGANGDKFWGERGGSGLFTGRMGLVVN